MTARAGTSEFVNGAMRRKRFANVILHAWQDPQTPAAPDLRAQFDYFRFERPHVPAALIGVNLADPTVVSDAELLAFLGDAVP